MKVFKTAAAVASALLLSGCINVYQNYAPEKEAFDFPETQHPDHSGRG